MLIQCLRKEFVDVSKERSMEIYAKKEKTVYFVYDHICILILKAIVQRRKKKGILDIYKRDFFFLATVQFN